MPDYTYTYKAPGYETAVPWEPSDKQKSWIVQAFDWVDGVTQIAVTLHNGSTAVWSRVPAPERFTVEHRAARKGETYWSPAVSEWTRAKQDHKPSSVVFVRVTDAD